MFRFAVPSPSLLPLVMMGTALIPPDPLEVGSPAPVFLIHASNVKVEDPSVLVAAPKLTYWLAGLVPRNDRDWAVILLLNKESKITRALITLVRDMVWCAVMIRCWFKFFQ